LKVIGRRGQSVGLTCREKGPEMTDDLLFAPDRLCVFAADVLSAAGYERERAVVVAEALTEASLRGIDTHGVVALLPSFVDDVQSERVVPTARPRIVHQTDVTARIDGQHAPGPVVVGFGLDLLNASDTNVSVRCVAARNSGYLGALAPYLADAAEAGLLVILAANDAPSVAPFGGIEPLHGTNPLGVGIPSEHEPMLIDMRTNALRMADYDRALKSRERLPKGTLLTRAGLPSDDPRDVLEGVMLPVGFEKGYSLALAVDVLSAALSGGSIGREVASDGPAAFSFFLLAIDPEGFGLRDGFLSAVERLCAQARAIKPAVAEVPVRVPGDRSNLVRRMRRSAGIPVSCEDWAAMLRELGRMKISVDLPDCLS
jgi:LDH2 family malate/lactate/ureidoglycolate dehydrogenase